MRQKNWHESMCDTLDGFENTPQESYSYGPSCSASAWIVFKDLG